eukprot:Rmarinus@m.12742
MSSKASLDPLSEKEIDSILSSDKYDILSKKSRTAKDNAYAPYSNFHVGCALITETGNMYHGCNYENGSYGLTICAERNAIGSAVADGDRNIVAMVITTDLDEEFCGPCGACRQVIVEYGNPLVILLRPDGQRRAYHALDLLPLAFTPATLHTSDALEKRRVRAMHSGAPTPLGSPMASPGPLSPLGIGSGIVNTSFESGSLPSESMCDKTSNNVANPLKVVPTIKKDSKAPKRTSKQQK